MLCGFWNQNPFRCGVFHGRVVLFLARSFFSGIFRIFKGVVQVRSASMTNKKPSGGVVCDYCYNPGHARHNCRKLLNKNRRFQSVHYQKSLKSTSTSITTLAESGKSNTCFLSSPSTWVIDSGATDYIIGNSSLFTTFQSHPSTSIVTLAGGSTSCVLGSKTIHPTFSITLTSVMSLLQFSFTLIFVSKLTHI